MADDKLIRLRYVVPPEPPEPPFRYEDDLIRMVKLLKGRGYKVSRDDVKRAWSDYSDMVCASWLGLPNAEEDLVSILLGLLTEE